MHQIIDLFPDKTAEVFERLSLVRHVTPDEGGFGALVVNLAKSPTDAQGAWLTLRYVTTKMDPARVAAFERNISGKVVDAADDAGNLLEFKSLNLDSYTDFVARQEFTQIRDQGLVFQAFAEANNKEFRLVFERPVPTKFQDLFDELIQPLLDKPNVVFESSFP